MKNSKKSIRAGCRVRPRNVDRQAAFALASALQKQDAEIKELRRQLANSSDAVAALLIETEQHERVIETLCAALEGKAA
jgi:3-hydroxyisobutyrate dehydrogenase-like beta-hydroxyacid dehydrogenase